jgi:hypothetical protein
MHDSIRTEKALGNQSHQFQSFGDRRGSCFEAVPCSGQWNSNLSFRAERKLMLMQMCIHGPRAICKVNLANEEAKRWMEGPKD